jgi:hypothetical protein
MLPFLKKSQDAASSTPVEAIQREPDAPAEGDDYDSMEAAAEDLCTAIKANDFKGVAAALRAAFELANNSQDQE